MISKIDFDILLFIKNKNDLKKDVDIRELQNDVYRTETDVLYSLANLHNKELIDNSNSLTKKGMDYLEKHKVDNAIILAAGMSTRFVPLNFEKPKGLIEVRGEVLIERQIKQLREVGVTDIYIVVGYMSDMFNYLVEKYSVKLIKTDDYTYKNNHASVYAAKDYLKNSIITSSDLYFTENIFQKYAYDAYYCSIFISGKTAERGLILDSDDKIIKTMYGDKCFDIWVSLGYAFFSERFSKNMIRILEKEMNEPQNYSKFWADFQDEHLDDLYMYAKKIPSNVVNEFDSLEELREFDSNYLENSGSIVLKEIARILNTTEDKIIKLKLLKSYKDTIFSFSCLEKDYICDIDPSDKKKIVIGNNNYYMLDRDTMLNIKVYINSNCGDYEMTVEKDLMDVVNLSKEFIEYHKRALPLCAAENAISKFANLPLTMGFQERYIMNNTYSFNMDDNFIGCEKLFPFYKKLSEVCESVFGARYVDPRPFTGMHCIDMVVKTVCKSGEKMMILSKEHGGHASVKPVVERLGIKVFEAPYDISKMDLDYDLLNEIVKKEGIKYILLAPSDIIKPLSIEKINTDNCVLMWDCSQLLGLIAAGLCFNPLKSMKNIIMFGGTHKTFPGPASGLILTNEKTLHDLMEKEINPKFTRHSQMHQKISLLFAMIEFEKYGHDYMKHMVYCSNYLAKKLYDYGFDVVKLEDGTFSKTHQIFIRCDKDMMDTIYDNAYKCEVTLNKKHKELFNGYGIRLGTQEIARYGWNDNELDLIAQIIFNLKDKNINVEKVRNLVSSLPEKNIKYAFDNDIIERFRF